MNLFTFWTRGQSSKWLPSRRVSGVWYPNTRSFYVSCGFPYRIIGIILCRETSEVWFKRFVFHFFEFVMKYFAYTVRFGFILLTPCVYSTFFSISISSSRFLISSGYLAYTIGSYWSCYFRRVHNVVLLNFQCSRKNISIFKLKSLVK